jgi:hypothetical protein
MKVSGEDAEEPGGFSVQGMKNDASLVVYFFIDMGTGGYPRPGWSRATEKEEGQMCCMW